MMTPPLRSSLDYYRPSTSLYLFVIYIRMLYFVLVDVARFITRYVCGGTTSERNRHLEYCFLKFLTEYVSTEHGVVKRRTGIKKRPCELYRNDTQELLIFVWFYFVFFFLLLPSCNRRINGNTCLK